MREIIIKYLLKGFKKTYIFIKIDSILNDNTVNITVQRNMDDKNIKKFVTDVIDKLPKNL
jgi:hypothetical protein